MAVELAALSQKAQDKKLGLDDMAGGVFSISNLGGIGGTSFTPIVNHPEVAILGISRGVIEPVWQDDEFVPQADAAALAVVRSSRDRRRRRRQIPALRGRRRSSSRSACISMKSWTSNSYSDCLLTHVLNTACRHRCRSWRVRRRRFYAADLGMQVTLVDTEANPGGVCLYRGCIPSKALLHVAKLISEAKSRGGVGREVRRAEDRSRQAARLQGPGRPEADGRPRPGGEVPQGELHPGPRVVRRRARR